MDSMCQREGSFYDLEDCFWRNETQYRSYYKLKILGYLDLTFCVIIMISNAFVIMVFSRKSASSSMNTIFTHIAITECLAGLSYVPRAWQEYFRAKECEISQHRTYFWEAVSMDSYLVAFTLRHIGVWLAVMLAVWRYIAVIHALKERHWCNPDITSRFIKLGYVFGVVMVIIPFSAIQVGSAKKLVDDSECPTSNYTIGNYTTIYEFQIPWENFPFIYCFCFIIYGVFLKLLPSIAFTFISYRLIIRLIEAKKKRKSLISQHLGKNKDSASKILIVILALFVIGEVPHGIFCLLTAYHGPTFYWRYYYYGMEFCNTLTHFSESLNLIIYYAMSHQFRENFNTLIQKNTKPLRNIRIYDRSSNSQETSRSTEETN